MNCVFWVFFHFCILCNFLCFDTDFRSTFFLYEYFFRVEFYAIFKRINEIILYLRYKITNNVYKMIIGRNIFLHTCVIQMQNERHQYNSTRLFGNTIAQCTTALKWILWTCFLFVICCIFLWFSIIMCVCVCCVWCSYSSHLCLFGLLPRCIFSETSISRLLE